MTADIQMARELATGAGEVLLQVRQSWKGSDPKELKNLGDRGAQEWLAAELARRVPGDAVLSEEAEDGRARLTADRVWIIDPLDGTREFSEPPRDDWAVHVALWEQGDLTAGAVARPAAEVTYDSSPGHELWTRSERPIRLAVSRSRPPAFLHALQEVLGAELVPMGSAGVKTLSVVTGECDAYVHAGGQYEWDSAAPVAVARSRGLTVTRVDGSPMEYNRESPWLPDLMVAHPDVVPALTEALQQVDLPDSP
ncbi:3'(2'),5'-bisphosphate nucleotidase [Kytococcus aerolatus]|uniref:3'(2'),5-bisphosphonucleoside 3'(2')-phosphohydrolase n=1 Tax=Kytococcus aerolatus TaxID=592308 RepID=A0A212T6L8_9MICO|nr:3'(2'),5'-bisphosphate nucleotidase CysQ [Kytococcus aerolatus]SNC61678.1 3'(2'),5'-bisphosphate nucleotidase [Kytococcus aerolatus]